MPRKKQKRTVLEAWIPKLCSILCPATGMHGPCYIFFFRKKKSLIRFVGQVIKGINLFPRNNSSFPFVQSNLYANNNFPHQCRHTNPAGLCKLEPQSGFKCKHHKKKKKWVSFWVPTKALQQHFSQGSRGFSTLTSLGKHHCRSSMSASLLVQISADLPFEPSLSLLKAQTVKFQLSVWLLQLPVSSQFTWTVIFLQQSTITNSTTWVFFYHRSFLPTSSAASTGSWTPQAQLRAN